MAKLIWITGLAGSGKTTLAREVYTQLKKVYSNVVLIDGDHLREIFGGEHGYSTEDRLENARRLSRLCHFLISENIHVVCSTMSLYKEIHDYNRKNFKDYFDIFLDIPMEVLIKRDKKQLYSNALAGKTENVVGINQEYDKPESPKMTLHEFQLSQLPKLASEIIQTVHL
ncbi:MAG: adenylyl-sulfate kinase [Bacteroidia bacterium]